MAYSRSRDTTILLCLGLFVIASSFCDCSTLTRLKALDEFRENSTVNQGQAEGRGLSHGRLLIGQNSVHGAKVKGTKATRSHQDLDHDYQADMGWAQPKQPRVQSFSRPTPEKAAVEQLLKMEPKVECTADSMKLHVQGAASSQGSLLFVDRGSLLSPLPLSKLPASCGYTIRSTQRDLVLVAPYDGCFVAHQENNFVLPLHWCGVPVRMLCPSPSPSSPNPPMVTCHTEGMVVKTEWTISAADIKVNLNGNWVPLMEASPRCGFSVVVHPEGVVISVHYAPCLEKKGGLYTLELAGNGEIKISCPLLSASEMPSKGVTAPTPSYNFGPAPIETQSPPPAVPQVPEFPQKPEAAEKKPPHPSNVPLAPEGQMPQPFFHFPFYPWPAQPEKLPNVKEPPVKPSVAQIPNGRWGNPLYPYVRPPNTVPPAHRPEQKPLPTSSPSVIQTTKGQRQQQYYPFYFLSPKPEIPPTQPPITTPPGKIAAHIPNPFNPSFGLPQKPIEPPTSQPEGLAPFNPFSPYLLPQPSEVPRVEQPLQPVHPETPGKELPENIVPPNPPVPQQPQGQIYQPFYHYPFPYPFQPQGPLQAHVPTTSVPTTSAPKSQVQQSLNPVQPEASKPQVPVSPPSKPATEGKGPSQPEVPQIHQYPYVLYPHPKPSTVQPPQPEAPRVQAPQYPYGLYPHPEPTEKPTTVQPPQPEVPHVHQYPYAVYPHLEPTEKPSIVQPPQPEAPRFQVPQYPYGLYPHPEPTEKPTTVQPPQPEAPRFQVPQYPYGLYPHPEPTEKPTTVQPPQPEAPRFQVPHYPYGLYPHPEPTEKPTTVQPPQPEAPRFQVPHYPYGLYPHPEPTEKPTPVQPPQPEAPHVHQYPYAVYPHPEPTEKPSIVQPPQPEAPRFQVPQYPYGLYPHPEPTEKLTTVQPPQSVTLPPVVSIQQPQEVTSAPPNDGGVVPQAPQPGSPHMSPLYCPQFCPTGFANCCPQIAFHQHVHHIVPPGPGSKDVPPVYSALPFVPPLAYSGFSNGLGTAVIPQKPTAATMQAPSSALISPPSPLPAIEQQAHFLPPDGNPAAPSISKRPVNPQTEIYPFVSNWPRLPHVETQGLPQRQTTDHNVLSKPQASGDPVNPMVQYKPYYIQYPGPQVSQPSVDMNNPPGPNFMYFIGQYQQKHSANQQNEHAAKQLQSSNMESSDSKGQAHPQVQGEFGQFSSPYGMLQDAQAPAYNSSQPQPIVSGSKKSKHDQNVNPRSESKSYVLLQHGPPGREPNSFRDLAQDENLQAQTFARHHSGKAHHLQNLIPQDKHSHLRWLRKMPNAIPVSASDGLHLLDSPKGPSFSAAHVKPEFQESLKDMWKPLAASNRRIPANVPREAFQQMSAASDLQGDGVSQDTQKESGNQET